MAFDLKIIFLTFISMLVRYHLGFGFSLVFMPLATIWLGFEEALRISILLEIAAGTLMVIQFWEHVKVFDALVLKIASLIGMGIGNTSTLFIPRRFIVIGSMVAIISTCIYFFLKVSLTSKRTNLSVCLTGLSSGFLNSWTSLSGPPVIIFYLRTEQSTARIKGLLSGYFWILYVGTFLWFVVNGRYQNFEGWDSVFWGCVTIVLGYLPIRRVARLVNLDLGRGSLIFIGVVAVAVIFKELM